MRDIQIAGNPLEFQIPLLFAKATEGTQLIAGSNGKKFENWAIRSQVPKPVKSGHGKGSETRWMSV